MDTAAALALIREQYAQGQYLQAYAASHALGPLGSWEGTSARLLAGRLALQLGAPRCSRLIHLRTWRAAPTSPEACCCRARLLLDRQGAYAAWRFLRRQDDWSDVAPDQRAEWFALHAHCLGRLRDFDRAERWLMRADALSPDDAWLYVERAALCEYEDKLPEAEASARRSLELHPWYRPAVQQLAHLLARSGQVEESRAFLEEALVHLESGAVTAQLVNTLMDLGQPAEALPRLDSFVELSPLCEPAVERWVAARRADALGQIGARTAAIAQARAAARPFPRTPEDPFYARLAERLALPPTGPAVRLEVELGPPSPTATVLPALAKFWGRPTEELDILAGSDSPDPREAKARGWFVAESGLTPSVATALVERGVPFLLIADDAPLGPSTPLVYGFDPDRDTLLVRTAGDRRPGEVPLTTLLNDAKASNPRGLLLVPSAHREKLAQLELPEAALHARFAELGRALKRSDRAAAGQALAHMRRDRPDHPLTGAARCQVARFDTDSTELLRALDDLLARFPDDSQLLLAKANALRDLGRREERLTVLRQLVRQPEPDPVARLQFVQSVMTDPRETPSLGWLLRSTIRQGPALVGAYHVFANLRWDEHRFREALELYRFASCLDDGDEQSAQALFRAARAMDQQAEALRFLRGRANRVGASSVGPLRSLVTALNELGQHDEALGVLEGALADRPSDGDLRLFAAEVHSTAGDPDRAADLLAQAEATTARPAWLRTAAALAVRRFDPATALKHWREILAQEPTASDAHRAVTRLLSETAGPAAARQHLDEVCERFPQHFGLNQFRTEWLRPGETAQAEPVIRQMIERFPHDAWAWRELALRLSDSSRHDEARTALAEAERIEPAAPSLPAVAGRVHALAERPEEARAAYREAIRRNIDNELAIMELVGLADEDEEQRHEAIAFVEEELDRQPYFLEAVLAWRDQAASVLEPEEVLAILERFGDDYPDKWAVTSALVRQYAEMGRMEEAASLAEESTERWPLAGRLWLDRATICRMREDAEGQIEALRQALRVYPGWPIALHELSEALESEGEPDEAVRLLEAAVVQGPTDAVNHGYLAEALWNRGDTAAAIEHLRIALRLDPSYEWAWRTFTDWAEKRDAREEVAELAREVTQLRPGDVRAWLALVRLLPGPAHAPEALAALDRAQVLGPSNVEVADLRAERLAEQGRHDDALAACRQVVADEGELPLVLKGRMAWVEAKRGNFPAAITRMQALVALEPNYYWGWQHLADWYNDTGRKENYLEAASELVRLRPDNPSALARRGEAKLSAGDRDGGKEDLRQAQQMAPDYSFAGMALFDALMQDEEYEQAETILEAMQEHIGDEFVTARQAQLAAKQGDKDAALEALQKIAESPHDAPWPLQSTVTTLRGAGWADEVDEVLAEAVKYRIFHPWAALTWVEGMKAQGTTIDQRLAVLDKLIALKPRFAQAYDCKAENLARAHRFDEARATCYPAVFGDEPPTILRGRAAWVEEARGDRAAAITRMRAVLDEDPDYYWGWQQIAQWYEAANNNPLHLEATEQLVRLAPRDAEAFGYRGEAKLAAGDRDGAKEDFRHAFALDRHYLFAGLHLIDAQIQDNELDAAEETLSLLRAGEGGAFVRLRALRLACHRNDRDAAEAEFHGICMDALAPRSLVQRSVEVLVEAGWADLAEEVLAQALAEAHPHPAVGKFWVERRLAQQDFGCATQIEQLLASGPLGGPALYAYIDGLAVPGRGDLLAEAVRRFQQPLRESSVGWGKVGSAWVALRDYAKAIEWMADWPERSELESEPLLSLAIALRALQRDDEAHRVHEGALALEGAESYPTTALHKAWLATDYALAGATDRAAELLSGLDVGTLDPYHRLVHDLAEAMVNVQQAGPTERGQVFADARERLAESAHENQALGPDPAIYHLYRRVVQRIALDVGGPRAWVWARWQALRPPLPKLK